MSFIVRLEVPITNYYRDGIFFKQFYFECEEQSPSKQVVIDLITKIHEENLQYLEYNCEESEEKEAIDIINLIPDEKWIYVGRDGVVYHNTFVEHPKFGTQTVNWDVIDVIKVNS